MKKLFAVLGLALNLLFSLDLHGIETMTGWENLQSGAVSISWCTYDDFPISRAETVLNHSIDKISKAIQDLDHYPDIFDRVTKINRLETDVIQIVLDMPFPNGGMNWISDYDERVNDPSSANLAPFVFQGMAGGAHGGRQVPEPITPGAFLDSELAVV